MRLCDDDVDKIAEFFAADENSLKIGGGQQQEHIGTASIKRALRFLSVGCIITLRVVDGKGTH